MQSICAEKISTINENIELLVNELGIASSLADAEYDLILKYAAGELDDEQILKDTGMSLRDYVVADALSKVAMAYPSDAARVLATFGMGAYKFGEGFTAFFEGIADGTISLAGAGLMFLGDEENAKKLQEMAGFNFAQDLWENNDAFKWLNRNSFFDKNSVFAKACYAAGEATGAALTAKGISSLLENGDKVEKALKFIKDGGNLSKDFLERTAQFEAAGLEHDAAVAAAAVYAGAGAAVNKVAESAGESFGSGVSKATGLGNTLGDLSDSASAALGKVVSEETAEKIADKGMAFGEKKVSEIVTDVVSSATQEGLNEVAESVSEGMDDSQKIFVDQAADLVGGAVKAGTKKAAGNAQKGPDSSTPDDSSTPSSTPDNNDGV